MIFFDKSPWEKGHRRGKNVKKGRGKKRFTLSVNFSSGREKKGRKASFRGRLEGKT